MLREILEEVQNESFMSKINNWFKNLEIVQMIRQDKLQDEYQTTTKVLPKSMDKIKEDNGWTFYNVKTLDKQDYLCFISTNDTHLVKEFMSEIKRYNFSDGDYWLSLGKIPSMEQNGVTPFYIHELSIDRSKI